MHKLYLCIECEIDGYLDDNHVIGMLTGLVKDSIARDHVVHHITFWDFFWAESLGGREIHSVIVSQMVIAHNWGWLLPQQKQYHINS